MQSCTSDTWVNQLTSAVAGESWSNTTQIITEDSGDFYILARFQIAVNQGWIKITKFSVSGTVVWAKDFNKVSSFGNNADTYDYSPILCVNSGSLVFTANGSSSFGSRVICLDTNDGSLKWAKSVSITRATSYDSYNFRGIFVNSQNGNIYLSFGYNSYFSGNYYQGIVTLSSTGTILNCLNFGFDGSNGYTNDIRGILTKSDGSILVYGNIQSGNRGLAIQGFQMTVNANGSAVTSAAKLYGNSTNYMQITAGALLSSGKFVAYSNTDTSLNLINLSSGAIETSRTLGGVSLIGAFQLAERTDGTIAFTGWGTSLVPSFATEWVSSNAPQDANNFLAVYSSDLTSLTKYRECGINLDSTSGSYNNNQARVNLGYSATVDRFIGVPMLYYSSKLAITSATPGTSYYRYACIPNYQGQGINSYAKFASATSSLPVTTSSSPIRVVSSTSYTPSTFSTTSSDYAPSVVITNSGTSWSFFSN